MKVLCASKKLQKEFKPFDAKITHDYELIGGFGCKVIDIVKDKKYTKPLFRVRLDSTKEVFNTFAVLVEDDFEMTKIEKPKEVEPVSFLIKILDEMDVNELFVAAKEIFEWHETAVLPNGVIRKYAQKLAKEGIPSQHVLSITEKYVLERCTKNYLKMCGE